MCVSEFLNMFSCRTFLNWYDFVSLTKTMPYDTEFKWSDIAQNPFELCPEDRLNMYVMSSQRGVLKPNFESWCLRSAGKVSDLSDKSRNYSMKFTNKQSRALSLLFSELGGDVTLCFELSTWSYELPNLLEKSIMIIAPCWDDWGLIKCAPSSSLPASVCDNWTEAL